MSRRLGLAEDFAVLVLDLTAVPMIDSSASLALEDAVLDALRRKRTVFIAGLAPLVHDTLDSIGTLAKLPQGCCQESRLSAFAPPQRLRKPTLNSHFYAALRVAGTSRRTSAS